MTGYGLCDWDSILDKGRDSALPYRVQTSTAAQSADKAAEVCFKAKRQSTESSWELSHTIITRLQMSSSLGTYRDSDGLSVSMFEKEIMFFVQVQWMALYFLDLSPLVWLKKEAPRVLYRQKAYGLELESRQNYSCDTANKFGDKYMVLCFCLLVNLLGPLQYVYSVCIFADILPFLSLQEQ